MTKRFMAPMTAAGSLLYNADRYYRFINTDLDCWEWIGPKNNCGYGLFGFYDTVNERRGMMTAHRLALTIKLGRNIKSGMNANHVVCHNRSCVNPAHIEEGTQREKLQAMNEQGLFNGGGLGQERGSYNHKQHHRIYKYSEEEIQWIRLAGIPEIQLRYNLASDRAHNFRSYMRTQYRWLPTPVVGYSKSRPGRKKIGNIDH